MLSGPGPVGPGRYVGHQDSVLPATPSAAGGVAQLDHDGLLDPYEQVLIWTESDVGIIVTPDEQIHLAAISDHLVADCIGDRADTFTARAGVVFWFGPTASMRPVNRMATLNSFAAAGLSARTAPLLQDPVLITSVDQHGQPAGLRTSSWRSLAPRAELVAA
jgi:hypothetical protein